MGDVVQALPGLEFLDSTKVSREGQEAIDRLYGSHVTHQVNSEMLFAKFQQMLIKYRETGCHGDVGRAEQDDEESRAGPAQSPSRRRSLSYLQVQRLAHRCTRRKLAR